MTDAISAFLFVAAACALPAALFTACTRRGLPTALRRAGMALCFAADAIERFRSEDERAVFVQKREAQ